ncbi:hypothetical protein TNCV_2111501 [Trichonephila clavipes]|nr:hypothetical protein TNCV_2111501 [Trichonephila clavipes]
MNQIFSFSEFVKLGFDCSFKRRVHSVCCCSCHLIDEEQTKPHETHHAKSYIVRPLLAVALSAIQVTVRLLARFHPNFEGEYPGRQGPLASHPLPPTSQEDFGSAAIWSIQLP